MSYPNTRLRRLRYNKTLREMVEDVHLRVEDFIYPVFAIRFIYIRVIILK